MAAVITPEDVTNGFATDVSASEIPLYIAIVDGADACLDKNEVPDDTQRALKLLAVRHLLALQATGGRGNVTSESAPSGASRSYAKYTGTNGTYYGDLLKSLDLYGCLTRVIDANHVKVGLWSVGGKKCRA